jgi:hypothetical protein
MSVFGNPATMYSPPNKQQHIFYRGDGNGAQGFVVEHTFKDPTRGIITEQWVGPNASYIQASRTPPLAADDPATMFTDDSGQQHIFYVGIDSGLHHVFYDPNRNGLIYEQWESGATGIPATMYTPGSDNQQHVYYRGTDGGFYQAYYDPKPSSLSSEQWVTPQQQAIGNPATLYYPPTNQQHLFYRLLGGGLGHTFYDPKSGRSTQTWLSPSLKNLTALGDPATMYSHDQQPQQHVFFVATSPENPRGGNFIEHIYYDSRNTSSEFGITYEQWVFGAMGDPATMYAANQQHTFYRGQAINNDPQQGFVIEHTFWDPTRHLVTEQWVGPQAVTQAKPAAGNPVAMFSSDNNEQHIFYRAIDGGIYQVLYDPKSGPDWKQWV